MSRSLTPSKRPNDWKHIEPNAKRKWKKSPNLHSPKLPSKLSLEDAIIRVLWPASKIDTLTSEDGIISYICQETGARVVVEEAVPGCDERVVVITGSDKIVDVDDVDKGTELIPKAEVNEEAVFIQKAHVNAETKREAEFIQKAEANEETEVVQKADGNEETEFIQKDEANHETNAIQKAEANIDTDTIQKAEANGDITVILKAEVSGDADVIHKLEVTEVNTDHSKNEENEKGAIAKVPVHAKNQCEDDQVKESIPEVMKSENETSSVRKAFLLIFEKLVETEPAKDKEDEENDKSSTCVVRLLVLSTRIGCLLGKGGSVIKQMSAESGAQIRVLARDKLPLCASAVDDIVQITGVIDPVRKALQSVSQQLLEYTPDYDSFRANTKGTPTHSSGHPHQRLDAYPPPYASGPRDFHESRLSARMNPSQEMLTFRLLCHDERVGGVIGRGGSIVKTLQQETGCDIVVMEGFANSEDKIIVISGPAHPDDTISPPQEAVLRVQTRIVRAIQDSMDKNVMARLLISSNQIGCLLGKGGSVIAEMRNLSGAFIRIPGKDQLPKCAFEDDELVQVNGDFDAVQEALLQITTKLRHNFFRDIIPPLDYPTNPAFMEQLPPFASYGGRRELSPPGMWPLHKFDDYGGPPHGAFHPHDENPSFAHNIHRQAIPHHLSDMNAWGPQQGLNEGGPHIGLHDFHGLPQRRNHGFVGGSHPAIITNTTFEVAVPRSLIEVICGDDGACLKQIRQISDAKIMIRDPKPGARETLIIISGTPEQTHAAQSLIQAFVMSESGSV